MAETGVRRFWAEAYRVPGSSIETERSVRLEAHTVDGALQQLLRDAVPAATRRLAAAGLTLEVRPDSCPASTPLIRLLDLRNEPTNGVPSLAGTVIAVTADAESALKAIRLGATDALPVPIDPERLRAAIEAAAYRALVNPTNGAASPDPPIVVRTKGHTYSIRPTDLLWAESQAPFVNLHTIPGTIRIRARLSNIERLLDPKLFARVHRSAVVRIDQITEIISRDRGDFDLVLRTGAVTRLARRRAQLLHRLTTRV